MKIKQQCRKCNKEFFIFNCHYKRGQGKYCSKECMILDKQNNKQLNCLFCKIDYKPKNRNNKNKFCSLECWYKYFDLLSDVKRICKNCNKNFIIEKNYLKKSRGLFCSHLCHSIFRGSEVIECLNCKSEFRHGKSLKAKFCCFACYRKYSGESGIEQKFRITLQNNNIPFTQEAKIGKYSVDFLINNVVIELDGDYWHKYTQERDNRKTKFLEENNFIVFRFTENEINTDILSCLNKVMLVI